MTAADPSGRGASSRTMAPFDIDAGTLEGIANATGGASRTVAAARTDPGDAGAYADAFAAALAEHEATLRRYANARTDAGDRAVAIRFADREGNRPRRFLVATAGASTDDVAELRVLEPEAFEALDRPVTHRLRLDWYPSRNAAAELRRFVDEFAAAGRDPERSYVATTAAKYGDSVEGDLFDELVARFS